VTIRLVTDAATLARSRFATSPAFEVVGTLRSRHSATSSHVGHWYARARARLDVWTMGLLHGLIPAGAHYVPDFLTPQPGRARETRDAMVAAIAATPEEDLNQQLDYVTTGRAVDPGFARALGGGSAVDRLRRPASPQVQELLDAGPPTLAAEAGAAFGRFFDVAIAEDWPRTTAVLEADISYRAEVMATHGIAAMLGTLGPELAWDGAQLAYPSRFDITLDWADDGVVLVPCSAHDGSILFKVAPGQTPVMMYPARGTALLWDRPRTTDHAASLADLLGRTRLGILLRLDEPRTTTALSDLDGHSTATVSHHLGILSRSGLVTSRRSGRGVLYWRTALGDTLVTGELPAPIMSTDHG
jgi:hypothetical protein